LRELNKTAKKSIKKYRKRPSAGFSGRRLFNSRTCGKSMEYRRKSGNADDWTWTSTGRAPLPPQSIGWNSISSWFTCSYRLL